MAIKMVTGEQLSLYFGIGNYVSAHSRQGVGGSLVVDNRDEWTRCESCLRLMTQITNKH